MYSGGESTDSQKCTQWAMNPAAYQNTSNDLVDWAALAQQWIIMKEAGPPPIPGRQSEKIQDVNEDSREGGEAEMDMDDRDDAPSWNTPEPSEAPPAPGAEAWTNWNPPATGQNWNWNSSWNPPSAVPPPLIAPVKAPLLPTPNNTYSPSDGASDNAVPYGGYNTTSQTSSNNFTNQQPAFWTGMALGKVTQTEIKPHNKRYSKVNVPTKVTIITPGAVVGTSKVPPPLIPEAPVVPTPTLDANKRKQLPAWIREGLEKMERDKLKELEKEKEKQVRNEYTEKMKLEELEKMEILKTTMKEKNLLKKSRFDSDNENSEDEEPVKKKPVSPPPPVPLTLEELMLKVRKTMTEILLKVTNQLIEQTCQEERQRYLKKRRASDQLASAPSGAIIKAKLGLGAYDEGSSSNEESDNDDQEEDTSDSDADLKESIRERRAAFSKTEQQIENRLAEAERKKDGSRSPSRSRSLSRDSHDSKSQVEANGQEVHRVYSDDDRSPKKKRSKDDNNSSSSSLKSRRVSTSHSDSRSKSRFRSESPPRSRKRRHSRSISSRRDRSASYNRKDSTDSKKRSRRSRSDSRYSKRSRRSRSHSYSSRKSSKRSHYSTRRSRTRSRSRDRKYPTKKSYESSSRRSRRSRSYNRSKRRSNSSTRSHKKSRSKRSSSRKRRSSRSSSRGKRSRRR